MAAARQFGASLPKSHQGVALRATTREGVAARNKLLDLLNDDVLMREVNTVEGKPSKGRVDEAIVSLERTNQCTEPAYSKLLDGTWKVQYAGAFAPGRLPSPTRELELFLYSGGYSVGNAINSWASSIWGQIVRMKVGDQIVRIIAGRDVEASAEIFVLGRKITMSYQAELMPLSAQRMSEEVVSVYFPDPIGKRDLPFELWRRSILITYLDEEVMVVRDESGVPDVYVRRHGDEDRR